MKPRNHVSNSREMGRWVLQRTHANTPRIHSKHTHTVIYTRSCARLRVTSSHCFYRLDNIFNNSLSLSQTHTHTCPRNHAFTHIMNYPFRIWGKVALVEGVRGAGGSRAAKISSGSHASCLKGPAVHERRLITSEVDWSMWRPAANPIHPWFVSPGDCPPCELCGGSVAASNGEVRSVRRLPCCFLNFIALHCQQWVWGGGGWGIVSRGEWDGRKEEKALT